MLILQPRIRYRLQCLLLFQPYTFPHSIQGIPPMFCITRFHHTIHKSLTYLRSKKNLCPVNLRYSRERCQGFLGAPSSCLCCCCRQLFIDCELQQAYRSIKQTEQGRNLHNPLPNHCYKKMIKKGQNEGMWLLPKCWCEVDRGRGHHFDRPPGLPLNVYHQGEDPTQNRNQKVSLRFSN